MEKELLKKARKKKAVLLDMDDTLYPYAPCHEAGMKSAYSAYRRLVRPIRKKQFDEYYSEARKNVKAHTKGQAASHSRLLYFKEMLDQISGKSMTETSRRLSRAYWSAYLHAVKVNPWVRPFVKAAKQRGLTIVIVTDLTTDIQLRKITRLRLNDWVDFVVTSEEAGCEKPADGIFQLAAKKARCKASECLIIGDDKKKDRWKHCESVFVEKGGRRLCPMAK